MTILRQCVTRTRQPGLVAGFTAATRSRTANVTQSCGISTSSSVATAPTQVRNARLHQQQLQRRQSAAVSQVVGDANAPPLTMPPAPASLQSEEGARWLSPASSLPSPQHPLLTFLTPVPTILQQDRLPHLKSMLEMAHTLLVTGRMTDVEQQRELEALISQEGPKEGLGRWPIWIEDQYMKMRKEQREKETKSDRVYRRARSLLWTPAGLDDGSLDKLIVEHARTMSEPMSKIWLQETERQEQLDVVLRPLWNALSTDEVKEALLQARFKVARMLGWRRGYSSGYPSLDGIVDKDREALLKKMRSSQVREAIVELEEAEDTAAWSAFKSMSDAERQQEEVTAWSLRDRSMVYLDDASSSLVCGLPAPRWFPAPQRQGSLVFLPMDTIRLVRNNTASSDTYDAFKATFRVPLHMHKHGLRSYLLAIYGLRTTWCRSMIYRAALRRNRKGQVERGSSSQTYKKVEVGLLEPFVFPEVTDAFKRKHLMTSHIEGLRQRQRFKASGRRGWRTTRASYDAPVDTQGAALEEKLEHQAKKDKEAAAKKKRGEFTLRTLQGGIPTKRHSYILKLLGERRKEREEEVEAHARKLQGQIHDAPSKE